MKHFGWVWLPLALAFAGCATMESGAAFDVAAAESFEDGSATRAEVQAALGPATQVTTNADGSVVLGYTHIISKGSAFGGSHAEGSTAVFVFDRNGILQRKTIGRPTARTR